LYSYIIIKQVNVISYFTAGARCRVYK